MKPYIAAFLITLFVVPMFGHHSVSKGFDETKATTIQGVITKVEWVNPHVWLYLDIRNANGATTNWAVEIAAPGVLTAAGVSRTTFEVSKPYAIEVWPARDGSSKANGRKVTFADGKTFDVSDKFNGTLLRPPVK